MTKKLVICISSMEKKWAAVSTETLTLPSAIDSDFPPYRVECHSTLPTLFCNTPHAYFPTNLRTYHGFHLSSPLHFPNPHHFYRLLSFLFIFSLCSNQAQVPFLYLFHLVLLFFSLPVFTFLVLLFFQESQDLLLLSC